MDDQTTISEPTDTEPMAPPTKDETNMAMLVHLLGLFTGFLGPLIIWLMKKDQSQHIDDQGKESLNFQITIMIVYIGLAVFSCVTLGFGALLYIPAIIVALVFIIIATIAASKGERYRYPICLRLIK